MAMGRINCQYRGTRLKLRFKKSHPIRLFTSLIVLLSILLTACGQQQASPTNTSIPTAPPSNTPEPEPTSTPMPPTPTLADPSSIPEDVSKNYLALLTLNITAILLEETAESIQSGDSEGIEAFASLITIAALLDPLGEALDQPPATLVLEKAWEDAKRILEAEISITARWFNDEIDSAIVLEELPGLLDEVNDMLQKAERALADEYNIDRSKFEDFREESMEDLRAEFESLFKE